MIREKMGRTLPAYLSKSYLGENVFVGTELDIVTELPTPLLTFETDIIEANINSMMAWVRQHGVQLAPHGKTTMTPDLWRAQVAAGAVGVTVANAAQARVAVDAGIPLIFIANEVISPISLKWLATVLRNTSVDIVCWVDSLSAVKLMDSTLKNHAAPRQLKVCVEIGAAGGRAGIRNRGDVAEVVNAVRNSPCLALAGFSGFEGAVPNHGVNNLAPIEEFLDSIGRAFSDHASAIEVANPILTAGGSAYFDLVVDRLLPIAEQHFGAQVILRSGAYLTHDDLHYATSTPFAARSSGPKLVAAATLWSRVLSVPESGLAVLDIGKRDIAYDIKLPRPRVLHRPGGEVCDVSTMTMVKLNDQHGYLQTGDTQLEVGDLIELGQAHPCTITDKWRDIPLVTHRATGNLRIDGNSHTYF